MIQFLKLQRYEDGKSICFNFNDFKGYTEEEDYVNVWRFSSDLPVRVRDTVASLDKDIMECINRDYYN